MENMDKGLTVTKWVLINWPKTQIPQNLSVQDQKFGISMKQGFIGPGVRSPCTEQWKDSR